VVRAGETSYALGVLVQANYGLRDSLLVAGVPVGQHLRDDRVYSEADGVATDTGSIIIVVATDAPFLPHQLERLARRAGMGLARMGSSAGNGSGDLFVAFSTANAAALTGTTAQAQLLANDAMDPFFVATVQATEEAITNALVAARDMQGTEGHYAKAIDHAALVSVLKRYGRLAEQR
jgi:D-aminopeptidase